MADERLHFCRQGLVRCLMEIGGHDRFNVLRFREVFERCFPAWADNSVESRSQAYQFIGGLRAEGETDIYSSLKTLPGVERKGGRPVIALIVTDGRPTTGLVRSSDIIGEFSKLNDGAISVFAIGTSQTANSYLLDLIGYCNRGDAYVVKGGRWSIADDMFRIMREIRRPVLSDVRFLFGSGSGCDVYPVLTSNLYLDRPLVLHGRYPVTTDRFVFQAVGQGGEVKCDMIFDVSLARALRTDDKEIRTTWAKQRVYHLLGQYARRADPAIMSDVLDTARQYRIDVPYRKSL
jgi:Ca-activated chloride channel family protein